MKQLPIFGIMFLIALAAVSTRGGVADNIKTLTGSRTRIVWVQHQGDGSDVFCDETSDFKLMGFDTDDALGERVILGTLFDYCRPLITYDGSRIVYSSRSQNKTYIVNWDGSGGRTLATGLAGDVQYDENTGLEWVYVYDGTAKQVHRYRIDDTAVKELIWSNTEVAWHWFQVSNDGTRASSGYPWPDCGMAQLPNVSWQKFGEGCWASLSPDNNYNMWIFQDTHRSVNIYDGDGTYLANVDLHGAPNIRGWEVYHPKWSNQVGFVTVTGPYSDGSSGSCLSGDCGNLVLEGGTNVEVYFGKMNAAMTVMEGWVIVTSNSYGDFYPDAWIDPGTSGIMGSKVPEETSTVSNLAEGPAALTGRSVCDMRGRPVDLRTAGPGVYLERRMTAAGPVFNKIIVVE